MINTLRRLYHLEWSRPSDYAHWRWWAFHVWNEYDDWLFNGVHGLRIFGLNIGVLPRWLDKFFWKLLPMLRFFNRRTERM